MTQKIAIDFGTTNTIVSRWNNATNQAETLSFPKICLQANFSPTLIPSILYIENEHVPKVLIGEEIKSKGYSSIKSNRFFRGFKRSLASTYKIFPTTIGNKTFETQEIGKLFLNTIIEHIKTRYSNFDLVVTLPVDSFEIYRKWLINNIASALPNIKVQTLDESTAAAIGYGITKPNSYVVVVDFGGGTLDVSIVKMPPFSNKSFSASKTATVIAKSGAFLGGEDIDAWLLDDILALNSVKADQIKHIYTQMKQTVEMMKIYLSTQYTAEFNYFDADEFKSYMYTYTRERFEDVLEKNNFYMKLNDTISNALQTASMKGINKSNFDKVVLIGGTSLIPSVQRAVKQIFGSDKVSCEKPFEAVAHGALMLLNGVNVEDYINHSYAIRYLNTAYRAHNYKVIFKTGTAYPVMKSTEIILSSSVERQPAIELVIAEIQHSNVNEVFVDDMGRLVTERTKDEKVIVLNQNEDNAVIAKLNPPGKPMDRRLKVAFKINAKKQLTATVFDNKRNFMLYKDLPIVDLK